MAARPRKNRSESTSNSGKASISARPRSSDTVSPIWSSETAEPPTVTLGSASKAVSAASATSSSSASARIVPVTSALSPFRDRPAGVASATPGTRASSPAAACARCSRLPAEPPTSRTMPADVCRPRRALELLGGAAGLRGLRREAPAGLELADDRAAHDAREGDEGEQEDERAPGARGGEAAKTFEHAPHARRRRAVAHRPGGGTSRPSPCSRGSTRPARPRADLRGPHRAHALLGCRAFATAHPSA